MRVDAISVEVAKLEMKPDDVLVVRLPDHLAPSQLMNLSVYLKNIPALFALGGRLAILPAGCELLVVSKAEVPPCAT
jgi:hypothetical protein